MLNGLRDIFLDALSFPQNQRNRQSLINRWNKECEHVQKKSDEISIKISEDEHFYMDERTGAVKCKCTDKDIRYPLISFDDLEYCPRCGEKIISHELDWDWSDKK